MRKNQKIKSKIFPILTFLILLSFCRIYSADTYSAPETRTFDFKHGLMVNASFWNPRTAYFAGYIIVVNNSSVSRELSVTHTSFSKIHYQKRILVPAGSTVKEKIFLPAIIPPLNYSSIEIKDLKTGDREEISHLSFEYAYRNNPKDIPIIRPRKAADMPDTFNQYFSMPQIFLSEEVWNDMSSNQREAFFDWIFLGGSAAFENQDFINEIIRSSNLPVFSSSNSFLGLGKISKSNEPIEHGSTNHLLENIYLSSLNTTVNWDSGIMNPYVLILIIFIFGIMIGPGVVLYAKKRKEPIIMLLIIPVISLASCIFILAFSILQDGVSPKIMRASVTHLDQIAGKAYTWQKIETEAPLGLFGSIDLPEDCIILLNNSENTPFRGYSTASGGRIKISKYILPRTPNSLALCKVEKRREKLDITENQNGIKVVNGIGTTILDLVLRDTNGNYWNLGYPLAPGKSAELSKLIPNANITEYAALPTSITTENLKREGKLAPGVYQAELEGNVFGEKIISGGRTIKDESYFLVGRYAK